jgi:capsular polysaccharide export protein
LLQADEIVTDRVAGPGSVRSVPVASSAEPFLRIPPFPGSLVRYFTRLGGGLDGTDRAAVADALRRHSVGGTFWAAQPNLPKSYVLVRSSAAIAAAEKLYPNSKLVLWEQGRVIARVPEDVAICSGDCDPWHMLAGAEALIMEAADEVGAVAALLAVDRYLFDPLVDEAHLDRADVLTSLSDTLSAMNFANPFTAEPMTALEAIELCGFWRRLIDANRGIAGGLGFAFWKQDHVAPLLWDGTAPFRFARNSAPFRGSLPVAVWRSKASQAVDDLERRNIPLIEVEDGFLRSRGLGADCVPPLSLVVDRLGPHFDPSAPSELECLLQESVFDAELIERARDVRRLIVAAGIGKYECSTGVLDRRADARRHILVPGQVEDDRAVELGGCGLVSNLELVARVRKQAPDAYILYKPHPDVLAGHRRGAIADATCLRFADEVVGDLPIASLIAMVDEVHVNTSLAGFEALLRGKAVTTYGVPFYAGWGLTADLGPVPARRTARRSIDELVAATLLLYPRYLDPETGLPCPAEVVVARLSASAERDPGLVVGMRRLQGRLMRRLRSLVQ